MKARFYIYISVILAIAIASYIVLSPVSPDSALLATLEESASTYSSQIARQDYYIVIDYDLPIFKKRLWVMNVESGEVVLNSHVSHAWNSGFLYATDCSNTHNSEKSCTGAFLTAESYQGQYGYAMRIDGLEKGINDRSRPRTIVFHDHFWPWSKGCFMTLPNVNRQLIDLTEGGTFLYVQAKTID